VGKVTDFISCFKCKNNNDLENFLLTKAIRNERADRCRTFFVIDSKQIHTEDKRLRILGYLSLATKSLSVKGALSKSKIKELDGINKNAEYIECYLIAQLGKNDYYKQDITGDELMEKALNLLRKVQEIIGKRVILVESVDSKKVLSFYRNKHHFEYIDTIEVCPNGDVKHCVNKQQCITKQYCAISEECTVKQDNSGDQDNNDKQNEDILKLHQLILRM
jgi:hypothetical protein